jgi:hypothetical protein
MFQGASRTFRLSPGTQLILADSYVCNNMHRPSGVLSVVSMRNSPKSSGEARGFAPYRSRRFAVGAGVLRRLDFGE